MIRKKRNKIETKNIIILKNLNVYKLLSTNKNFGIVLPKKLLTGTLYIKLKIFSLSI